MLKKLRKNYYVPEPQVLDAQDFGLASKAKKNIYSWIFEF
jgi:hypothetical protein